MLTLLFHVISASAVAAPLPDAAPSGFDEAGLPMPESAVAEDDDEDDDDDVHGFSAISSELGLSADQKAKIQEIIYASKSARIDQKAKAAKAKLELKQLLTTSTLDEKAVNKALESFIAAEGELQRSKIKLLMDMRKQLSAEQWTKLVELRESRKGDRRDRMRERMKERMEERMGDDD